MSMSHRCLISAAALAAAIAGVSTSLTPVAAQAPAMAATFTPPKSSYVPPKTPWGDPDIQGVYDYQSVIPMQRPAELAGKATFTESELAADEQVVAGADDWCVGTHGLGHGCLLKSVVRMLAREVGATPLRSGRMVPWPEAS